MHGWSSGTSRNRRGISVNETQIFKELHHIREENREDFRLIHEKIDKNNGATMRQCAAHAAALAVLKDREAGRDKRINQRIAIGVLIVAMISAAMKLALG